MVKINRVWTHAGDDGRTLLVDGARRPKFDRRICTIGSIDEADAFIGLACLHVGAACRVLLQRIQNDLFDVGADLCRLERSGLKVEPLRLVVSQVAWVEQVLVRRAERTRPSLGRPEPGRPALASRRRRPSNCTPGP